jgi:autotransporter-associated beta strand protein
MFFTGSATAGSQTVFTNRGSTASKPEAGVTTFSDQANAGQATFINNPAEVVGFHAGQMGFFNQASAANGTFIANGASIPGANAATIYFSDGTTAGNATFIINGGTVSGADGAFVNLFGNDIATGAGTATFILNGGPVQGARGGSLFFLQGSLAEDATIIANSGSGGGEGGTVHFNKDSQGIGARIELFGNGKLNVSSHEGSGVTIGSLEGDGLVLLGRHNLSIGGNNLSSKFAGVISQTGSVTKVGSGNVTLSGANTYSGGTTIRNGSLLIANTSGSATGSGAVTVQHGRLGGLGVIAGSVSVGTGAGGAFLLPGDRKTLGILTIQSLLTLSAYATYDFAINSSQVASDAVAAQGVTINSATLLYADNGTATLPPGTVFTVISNTSADPIVGVFNNLPDGAIVTVGGNTFQASYSGGDGNDLTLTVVP